MERQYLGWERMPLDAAAMHEAAQALPGERDFSAFRSAQCQATHARRNLQQISVTRTGDEVHRPTHHREALSAWAGAGADLLLSGHIHLPAVVPVAVEPLPAPPGAEPRPPRRVWSIQAGTAISRRLREGIPNTVMLLEGLSGERHGRLCRCETWQCPPEGGAFRRVASQLLALSPLRG